MNRTLFALWAIIVGSILAIVALAVVWNRQRESQAKLDLGTLLRSQLEPYRSDVQQVFESYDRQLQQALNNFDPQSTGAILALERQPLSGQVVIVGSTKPNPLLHPDLQRVDPADRSLVTDAWAWIRDNNFGGLVAAQSNTLAYASQSSQPVPPPSRDFSTPQAASQQAASQQALSQQALSQQALSQQALSQQAVPLPMTNSPVDSDQSHWTTWYHGRGVVLGYWSRSAADTVTMVIVPRGRWLADMVAALPDNRDARSDATTQLIDVEGNVLTQWGAVPVDDSSGFDAELSLAEPLDGWRLRLCLSRDARAVVTGKSTRWLSALGAIGTSGALISLGLLITLNLNRQLRLAAQQVSFVNQVSHELRTPLTNIRMYTELTQQSLESHADAVYGAEVERLSVVQQECDRLGRLIENVLSFARAGRHRSLRMEPVEDIEALIDECLAMFRPQLTELGMRLERVSSQVRNAIVDREVLQQILINLFSNTVKYAAAGKLLRIETVVSHDEVKIRIIDAGPGIAKRMRKKVFEPFVRVSSRLEDPAGTGIGLSIARQLARLHGGDCLLETGGGGCCFAVRLRQGKT